MKTLAFTLSLALAGVSAAQAQVYQPTVVRDSVIGAVAGALIGGHNHDRWAQGAVIGAAAGALVGATVDQPRVVTYTSPPVIRTVVAPAAPQAPMAPTVGAASPQVVYVSVPAPAPTVVYVDRSPDPVYYGYGYGWGAPSIYFSTGWYGGGHRWHGGYYHGGGHYRHGPGRRW